MNKKKKRKPQHYITRWDGIRIPIYFESIDIDERADGWCYDPSSNERKIIVDESLGKRRKLNVIIEEITLLWNSSFEDIDEYFFIFSIFFTLLVNARLHDIGEWILTPGRSNRVIPLFQRLLSKGDTNENEYGKPPTTIKILNFYLN